MNTFLYQPNRLYSNSGGKGREKYCFTFWNTNDTIEKVKVSFNYCSWIKVKNV